jgi:uncharacterized protein (DUF2249 family)
MPVVIDARGLQPPEPLERTLAALETLADGEELTLLIRCHPVPLFAILEGMDYDWQETVLKDGTHRVAIRRRAAV